MSKIILNEKERLIQQKFGYSDEKCRKISEIMEDNDETKEKLRQELFKTQPRTRKITDFL